MTENQALARKPHRSAVRSESVRNAQRRYREAHPERIQAARRRYREAHLDRARESARKWREANPSRARAARYRWVKANPGYALQWREANRERLREADRKKKSNPDRWALRRARKAAAAVERVLRARVYERDRGLCYYCEQLVPDPTWHLAHVIALSRGGAHSYANTAVAHSRCNLRARSNWYPRGAFAEAS